MYGYQNYDKFPKIKVNGEISCGYDAIVRRLGLGQLRDQTVVMDCYVIVDREEILRHFAPFFDNIFISDDCAYQYEELTEHMQRFLTEDRVFGILTTDHLEDFFIPEKICEMRREIEQCRGRTLVIGVGAMLIARGDINIHLSIARWETQQRFRRGACNWNCDNSDMDTLTKFKRGYFVEWRLADKHKQR